MDAPDLVFLAEGYVGPGVQRNEPCGRTGISDVELLGAVGIDDGSPGGRGPKDEAVQMRCRIPHRTVVEKGAAMGTGIDPGLKGPVVIAQPEPWRRGVDQGVFDAIKLDGCGLKKSTQVREAGLGD